MEQEIQQEMQQQFQSASVDDIEVDQEFNEECLEAHNKYRELHGCPPLELSIELASSAQAWANYLASIGQLKHSTPNPKGSYGENIAMKMVQGSQEYKGTQCTAQWYSEIEMYDFNGGENQMNCGHFSQVVCKSTKEAGFGKAMSPDGKMFAVGQYSPPGNFMNKWRANIPAPLSGEIQAPSRDDIIGQRPGNDSQRQQKHLDQQIFTGQGSGRISLGGGGGGSGGQEPEPADPRDRPVGKATKTRIVNGEKTVTVMVTFARPDCSRYQLSKETSSSQSGGGGGIVGGGGGGLEQELIIQPTRFRRNFAAAPTSSSANGGAEEDIDRRREQFAKEVARQHSQLRRRHGAPELQRSERLDRLAQDWAESLAKSGRLSHRGGQSADSIDEETLGQNIAKRPVDRGDAGRLSGRVAGQQLVQQWYGERHRFSFGEPDPGDICGGHFSQLVWCSSEELGIGLAIDRDTGDEFAVCFYRPAGNISGQFADNVLPSYD